MKHKIYYLSWIIAMALLGSSCKKQVAAVNENVKYASVAKITAKDRNVISTKTGTTQLVSKSGTGSDILYIDAKDKDTNKIKTSRVLDVTFKGAGTARIYAKILWKDPTRIAVVVPCGAQTGPIELQEFWAFNPGDGTESVIIHQTESFTITPLNPWINSANAYKPFDSAREGATLTITGGQFGIDPSVLSVKFPGNVTAKVIGAYCDNIVVEVPPRNPAGPLSGPITVTIAGVPTATGPIFTYAAPLPNPYNTFVAVTWPRKYDGTVASTIRFKALAVDADSGNIYLWDAGSDPFKEGRILEYKPGTAGFVNLLNTSTTGMRLPNISDMDISVKEGQLYAVETLNGSLWNIDIKKAKTDPATACQSMPITTDYYRTDIKFFPIYPGDGGWRTMLYSRSGSGIVNPQINYASFSGITTPGSTGRLWYNATDIKSPAGIEALKDTTGVGVTAYVADKETGRILMGSYGSDKYSKVFASGISSPKDIAISDKTAQRNSLVCIACNDGVRVYDLKGEYRYTLKLFNRYDGKTYPADFVAVIKNGRHIYAGSYGANVIFDFYIP